MNDLRALRSLALTLLAAGAASCGGDAGQSGQSAQGAASPAGYAKDILVDTDWIEAHASDPSVRILEVGGNAEDFDAGHVPGASFLPMARLSNPDAPMRNMVATREQMSAALSELGVERDQTLVLYDRQRNLQAARAYWAIKYYQHPEVRVYNGGAPRWTADERALTPEVTGHEPSDYQAGPADPEINTDWRYVVDHIDDPATITCDVRSPNEYLGRDVRAERGGHVPGSINIEWTAAVRPDGTFKPASELSRLYAAAGFTADKHIITYCQSGVRGAHTWFVLHELLGYPNVRNYDGSWGDYGNNPESPIES